MKDDFRGWTMLLAMGLSTALSAQQSPRSGEKKPYQAQSTSTMGFSVKDKQETIEITNVDYELTGSGIPGRPRNERLVLRKATRTKEVVDEIGMEASTTIQAWPLGVDLKQKPLYSLTVPGVDARNVASELLVVSRGLEEVEWWSVYTLASGAHLFDTYVPLIQLSIGWPGQELRFAGVEAPPDDASDARLRAPNVVAVLTYASAERVIREAMITCDQRELAQLLRSYADSTRKATLVEHPILAAPGKKATGESSHSITFSVSPNFPSPPATYTVSIPIAKDDLDVAHATASAGLHVALWKR
jgi:hypothetical protein